MNGCPLSLREKAEQDVFRRHKGALLTRSIDRSLHDALRTARIVWDILSRVQDILKSV